MEVDKAVLVVAGEEKNRKEEAGELLEEAARRLGKADTAGKGTTAQRADKLGRNYRVFEVPYNPASLKLQTGGGNTGMKNSQAGKKSDSFSQIVNPALESLSFELILDGEACGPKLRGLLGMTAYEERKQVLFCWKHLSFFGELTQMDARYTMFREDGTPIRGTVSMTIRQTMGAKGQDSSRQQAFEGLFRARKNQVKEYGA